MDMDMDYPALQHGVFFLLTPPIGVLTPDCIPSTFSFSIFLSF
jgi:hypothetical protein